jgi:hypothetical protein
MGGKINWLHLDSVFNIIALWNTIDMDSSLIGLRAQGYPVGEEDFARLSPFIHESHINLLGRYSFAVPDAVCRGEPRPL